jgi:RimJ/RimL family protein N-acetyltransferase
MEPIPNGFCVRTASQDDAETMAVAHVEGWQVGYRGLVPDDALDAIDVDLRADRWRQLLTDRTAEGLVIEAPVQGMGASTEVVGFSIFGPLRDEPDADASGGIVSAFYLRPLVWGTGAAAALMAATEHGLLDRDLYRARLYTIEGNVRARRFYEKSGWVTDAVGFEHESRQPGMPHPVTLRAVRYTKGLA